MSLIFRDFSPDTDVFRHFDCGDDDLNAFLLEKETSGVNATLYENEHLARTYIVEDDVTHHIAAYFSLLNDKIEREVSDSGVWNKLSRKIPNSKRRSSYPALKIGRLAVDKYFQGSGLGRSIITFIQAWFLFNSRAGCRFVTVDALLGAEAFYGKCDFKPLSIPDAGDLTILMYYDLLRGEP